MDAARPSPLLEDAKGGGDLTRIPILSFAPPSDPEYGGETETDAYFLAA